MYPQKKLANFVAISQLFPLINLEIHQELQRKAMID